MHLWFCIYSDPLFIWCGSGCGCYCSLCPLCGSTNDVHAWQFWLLIIYFFRIPESKRARCWWGEQGVPSSAGSLFSQFWGWPPLHRSSEHILCGHGFLAFHRQLPGGLFFFLSSKTFLWMRIQLILMRMVILNESWMQLTNEPVNLMLIALVIWMTIHTALLK